MSSGRSLAPDWVTAYNTSSTSLVVKWSHVPRQFVRGKPIEYNIVYASFKDSDVQVVRVNYTTNTINLTNLYVYARYAIAVSVVSSGGEGYIKATFASTGENRLSILSCLSKLVHFSKFHLSFTF